MNDVNKCVTIPNGSPKIQQITKILIVESFSGWYVNCVLVLKLFCMFGIFPNKKV